MANINDIPKGYAMTGKLNLRADPREYRRWNLFSLLTGLVLIAAGWLWRSFAPLQALLAAGFSVYALRILALAAGLYLYAQLYQLTRALLLRLLGGQAPCWRRQGVLPAPDARAAAFVDGGAGRTVPCGSRGLVLGRIPDSCV